MDTDLTSKIAELQRRRSAILAFKETVKSDRLVKSRKTVPVSTDCISADIHLTAYQDNEYLHLPVPIFILEETLANISEYIEHRISVLRDELITSLKEERDHE